MNTQIHSTTHFTPYELLFGKKALLPQTVTQPPRFSYSYEDYYKQLQLKLNKSFEIAKQNIDNSKLNSKKYYDKKINNYNFKVGDLVYVLDKSSTVGLSKKLSPSFRGPYEVIKVNSNESVVVKIKNKSVTYHKNLLKPFVSD